VARYDIGVRECAECGLRLPRALSGAGRPLAYCSPACRQRAYRRRGGRSSGTTGAARRRQARQSPEASWPPGDPELKVTAPAAPGTGRRRPRAGAPPSPLALP